MSIGKYAFALFIVFLGTCFGETRQEYQNTFNRMSSETVDEGLVTSLMVRRTIYHCGHCGRRVTSHSEQPVAHEAVRLRPVVIVHAAEEVVVSFPALVTNKRLFDSHVVSIPKEDLRPVAAAKNTVEALRHWIQIASIERFLEAYGAEQLLIHERDGFDWRVSRTFEDRVGIGISVKTEFRYGHRSPEDGVNIDLTDPLFSRFPTLKRQALACVGELLFRSESSVASGQIYSETRSKERKR